MFTRAIFVLLSIVVIEEALAFIKLERAEIYFVNPNYFNNETFRLNVIEVNDTYSRIDLSIDVLYDLPREVFYETVMDMRLPHQNRDEGPIKLAEFNSLFCLYDPNCRFIPYFLRELTKKGHCILQGLWRFQDAGIFEFGSMFPPIGERNVTLRISNVLSIFNIRILHYYVFAAYSPDNNTVVQSQQ